jgi:TonB family protein
VTQIANTSADNPVPHYPPHANWAQKEGSTLLDFIIDADGTPDLSSIQVVRATYTDFASAVLENFPNMHFIPLTVEGCPVRVRVGMPFEFKLHQR